MMLPEKLWSDDACYVLFEGAELKGELRERLLASESEFLRPLLIHPDLFELINLGPWLWRCQQASASLLESMTEQGLVLGLIHSQRSLDELQQQLAMGCMVVEPKGLHSQLLRFYTAQALPLMLAERQAPWYGALFGGIECWWTWQCEDNWAEHQIEAIVAPLLPIQLSEPLFAALMGDKDLPRLLNQWREGHTFSQFPACLRTAQALKALGKADKRGASAADRLLWALIWLEGGNKALNEEIEQSCA
ncbi:DUF4123 domain-containing protein [Aeromonas popoffii]|jgi:hypothetical protein|uniref:DUF4123 domain-containing protein n=1 Tax=Aeromonas popoffii TaxID=70856 RepID=UPI0030D1594D